MAIQTEFHYSEEDVKTLVLSDLKEKGYKVTWVMVTIFVQIE